MTMNGMPLYNSKFSRKKGRDKKKRKKIKQEKK